MVVVITAALPATAEAHRIKLHTRADPAHGWPVLHELVTFRGQANREQRSNCRSKWHVRQNKPRLAVRVSSRKVWLQRWRTARQRSSLCLPIGPPGTIRLGKQMATAYGWTEANGQFPCLRDLWGRLESSWYVYADNPTSTAYGIPQALPGSKMGPGWRSNARVQIRWGLGYIRGRYNTPCEARAFRLANRWY